MASSAICEIWTQLTQEARGPYTRKSFVLIQNCYSSESVLASVRNRIVASDQSDVLGNELFRFDLHIRIRLSFALIQNCITRFTGALVGKVFTDNCPNWIVAQ